MWGFEFSNELGHLLRERIRLAQLLPLLHLRSGQRYYIYGKLTMYQLYYIYITSYKNIYRSLGDDQIKYTHYPGVELYLVSHSYSQMGRMEDDSGETILYTCIYMGCLLFAETMQYIIWIRRQCQSVSCMYNLYIICSDRSIYSFVFDLNWHKLKKQHRDINI